jgi:hypothetical protein
LIHVTTQREFNRRRNPGFCYLCGEKWKPGDKRVPDHVVPKNAALPKDREPAFILLVHDACNDGKSRWDERIGQVFKMLHGTLPHDPSLHRLEFIRFIATNREEEVGGIGGLDLHRTLIGWLMGFHALLYREYLPHTGLFAVTEPWPSFVGDPNYVEPIQAVHSAWVETLQRSRAAATIDRVVAWKGHLRYECTWSRLNDGRPACVFALDIYDWTKLSGDSLAPKRSCTGLYATAATPNNASRETSLVIPLRSRNVLNAFGDPWGEATAPGP